MAPVDRGGWTIKLAFPATAPRFAREAPARLGMVWKGDEIDQHWRTERLAECVRAVTFRCGEGVAVAVGVSHGKAMSSERNEKPIFSTPQVSYDSKSKQCTRRRGDLVASAMPLRRSQLPLYFQPMLCNVM